jgi:DNA-binding transcriptional LysR family regulator
MIDPRRLRVLHAVADHGTLAAAAAALHLTPPAVSQQLTALERETGHRMVARAGRGVRLTSAAALLLRHAVTIQAELERAEVALAEHDHGRLGRVRLAGFATGIATIAAPTVAKLRSERPGLELHVDELDSRTAFVRLAQREVDVVVEVATPDVPGPTDERFTARELTHDVYDVAVPDGHPLSGGAPLSLAQLAGVPSIAPMPDSECDYVVRAALTAAGVAPEIVASVDDFAAVLALVRAGAGIAFVPRLAGIVSQPGVTVVPLAPPVPARWVSAWTRRGADEAPAVAVVLAALAQVASSCSVSATSAPR